MITEYQRRLRDRCLAAPVMSAPAPWPPALERGTPVGGLLGIGFAVHPDTGHDLDMVVSHDGRGLFDAAAGEKIARDRHPDPATSIPGAHPDLVRPGLGPVAGTGIRIAGLFGGGPHGTAPEGCRDQQRLHPLDPPSEPQRGLNRRRSAFGHFVVQPFARAGWRLHD
ncbi:hypothetical protein OG389_30840 [Streptomyces sp. NBC_00435]|uniref:hypothetical protein n=1 Tax=Streptomyces sp. NBC_00435 TaxID=2903649 RepID=UPI002E1A4476